MTAVLLYACLPALLIALVATPVAARIARRFGIVDRPGVRKVHQRVIPYLGGLAILVAMLFGSFVGLVFCPGEDGAAGILNEALADSRLLALLGGALFLFALGLYDDARRVRARYKLLAQVAVSVVAWACGLRVDSLQLSPELGIEFGTFSVVLTVLWIVTISNAINLIDGLDGLAGGIAAIAAAAIAYVSVGKNQLEVTIVAMALFGALVGFLRYNAHPASIFMGDSGSMQVGYILACLSIYSSTKSAALFSVAVPLAALGVPLLDTVLSFARRIIERRSVFSPDRRHIHHRLLELGYGHRRAVLIVWGVTAAVTVLGIGLLGANNWVRLLALGVIFGLYLAFFRLTGAVRLRESVDAYRQTRRLQGEAAKERALCDELLLVFRECHSFGDWWEGVQTAAERLGLCEMQLSLGNRDGTTTTLVWGNKDATAPEPSSNGHAPELRVSMPIRQRRSDSFAIADLAVPAHRSLESAGHRVSLFARLVEEHSLAELAGIKPAMQSLPDPQGVPARTRRA